MDRGPPKRIMTLPYHIVILCAICACICYCDRVNISVAVISMAHEYGWDKSYQGQVLGTFYYGYVMSSLLASWLGLRFGAAKVLMLATFVWSLLTIVTPAASRYSSFVLLSCRVLLGLAEGMAFPCIMQIFGESDVDVRSRNCAIIQAGCLCGTIIAIIASNWIIAYYNWEMVFYFFGAIGLVWCACWWYVHTGKGYANFLLQSSNSHSPPAIFSIALIKNMAVHTSIIPIYVSHFCHAFVMFSVGAWLPSYFHDTTISASSNTNRNTPNSNPLLVTIPYICMAVTAVVASHVADNFIMQGVDRLKVRRMASVIACGGAATCFFIFASLHSGPLATLFLCLALSFSSVNSSAHEANKLEVVSSSYTGILQGISNTYCSFSGIIAVPLAGYLYTQTGSWNANFFLFGLVFIGGGSFFYRRATITPCM